MKTQKLDNMWRGWFIGDFDPSVLKTKDFEVGVLTHKKDEVWPAHYHTIATEYNVLISGHMSVCGKELHSGDIFVIESNEIARPVFHEDCIIVCVKTPSATKDKYEVL
jgi:quercetin dioxygenase-like cupin family protein